MNWRRRVSKPGTQEFTDFVNHWKGLMFFVPAFVGGIFGLLGDDFTDLLGLVAGLTLEHPDLCRLGVPRALPRRFRCC